jgi:WD40 repeat protein
MRFFISYARVNREQVDQLVEILDRSGHDVWIDKEIAGGDDWWQLILDEIEQADVFVFVLSTRSSSSMYCQTELRYALDLKKPVLPVMIERAEFPFKELSRTHYVNALQGLEDTSVLLEITKSINRIQDKKSTGSFPEIDHKPPRPELPQKPDPLSEIRSKVEDLRGVTESELAQIVYELKQFARTGDSLSIESREIMQKIVNSPHIPQGIAQEIRETLDAMGETTGAKRETGKIETPSLNPAIPIGSLLAVVVIGVALFFLFSRQSQPLPTDTSIGAVATNETNDDSIGPMVETQTEEPPDEIPEGALTATASQITTGTMTPTETLETSDTPTTQSTNTPVSNSTLAMEPTATTLPPPSPTVSAASISTTNTDSIEEVGTLQGHNSTVRTLDFSPDGNLLASGSSDFTVRIWDVETQSLVLRITEHSGWVNDVEFSIDGSRLVTASDDSTVRTWDVETGGRLGLIERNSVQDVEFSSDGSLVAIAQKNGTIEILGPGLETSLVTLQAHDGGSYAVSFSLDGSQLASGGGDNTIKIWDTETGDLIQELIYPGSQRVTDVEFHPTSDLIAASATDGTVRMWDIATGGSLSAFAGDIVWDIEFDSSGEIIAIADNNSTSYLWNWSEDNVLVQLFGHSEAVRSITLQPQMNLIASGGQEGDNEIKLWGVPHEN